MLRKARILTKKARILPKNKNLAAIILDLGQDLGQDTQESGQDLRKDTHEFRQDLGKMKFKILSCHKILPKNLAQEFFAGRIGLFHGHMISAVLSSDRCLAHRI